MAVVADRISSVRGMLPRKIGVGHDVAVDARRRIVAQVRRRTGNVSEQQSQAAAHSEQENGRNAQTGP